MCSTSSRGCGLCVDVRAHDDQRRSGRRERDMAPCISRAGAGAEVSVRLRYSCRSKRGTRQMLGQWAHHRCEWPAHPLRSAALFPSSASCPVAVEVIPVRSSVRRWWTETREAPIKASVAYLPASGCTVRFPNDFVVPQSPRAMYQSTSSLFPK